MHSETAIVLDSRGSVDALMGRIGRFGFGRVGPIEVRLPDMTKDDNDAIGRRLSRHSDSCGCDWSAALALAAPAAFVVYLWLGPGFAGLGSLATAAGLFLAGGFAGKAIGRQVAHLRLRRRLRSLMAQLPPE